MSIVLILNHVSICDFITFRGKAVSEGAIVYYLEHYVSSRKAPATYGTPVCIQVNPFDSEHHKRIDLAIPSMAGLHFEDGFSTLVNKVIHKF